jgi:hypothetical protein
LAIGYPLIFARPGALFWGTLFGKTGASDAAKIAGYAGNDGLVCFSGCFVWQKAA